MTAGPDLPNDDSSLDEPLGPVPVLAVVGRPNVGKSTLVNRIIGRREAVVEDVPGVTRDRVSYDANWAGRAFTVVDTGGWDPDARGLATAIADQAEIAIQVADAVLFVVDANVGITDVDEQVVKILRKADKPVVLAANKVDDQRGEAQAATLWNLGLGEPYPVSALPGPGVTQGSSLTTTQRAGYNAYVTGLRLYVPLTYRVRLSPSNKWPLTFSWTSSRSVFIA